MASRSQPRGQAIIELLFLILFTIAFYLKAINMADNWINKNSKKHRFTSGTNNYESKRNTN